MKKPCFTKEQIETLEQMIRSQYSNIQGLKVTKNNQEVFMKSFNQVEEGEKYNIASVTKSILSLLIGIAIDQKLIKGVDEPVMSFFPEYDFRDDNLLRDKITIRDLLTMTTPFPFPSMQESFSRMCRQEDWIKYGLEMMGRGDLKGGFKYSTIGSHILSAVLTKVTKMSAREFANLYLFTPLKIKPIPFYSMTYDEEHLFGKKVQGWVMDPSGISAGGWGLTLSIDEMTKIGQLYLNDGVWNHQQVVSSKWLEESRQVNANHYGYMWWLGESDEVMSIGSGGSLIYVHLKEKIVIAIASTIILKPRDRKELLQEIVSCL